MDLFRDEVIWNHVAQSDGQLKFASMREAYPGDLADLGAELLLLAYSGHPEWEEGHVPQKAEGQAAFARYQAQILERFPDISVIEIGNEFNSWEFAELEGWPPDLAARAQAYVDLLAATADAVRAVRPGIEILGGAAHSVPVAWAEAVVAAGGLDHMDAFVLHPYTTRPEMMARQIEVLRQVPGLSEIPIAITEFGTTQEGAAPGYLIRMYCQMSLGGVTRAIWYPFSPRGDGLVPLVAEDGMPTETGQAFALIRAHLEGEAVSDVAPDAFTYACKYGDSALVIWGAPRDVSLAAGLRAMTSRGGSTDAPLRLSRDEALLILSDGPAIVLGDTVKLGAQTVLADSYDGFSYLPDAGMALFVRRAETDMPLEPRPGQEADGVPWTPYLGLPQDGTVRVGADWAVPSSWGPDDPLSIVYRYEADTQRDVDIRVEVAPDTASTDGVLVTLLHEETVLSRTVVTEPVTVREDALRLDAGERVEVLLGPNISAEGDHTRWRVTISGAQ
ncbi:MAG: hypothetical protein ACE369_11215 [Roseovarius sp.]